MEVRFPFLFFVTEVESNGKDCKPEEEEQVIHEDERPYEKSNYVQNYTSLKNTNSLFLFLRLYNILFYPQYDCQTLQFK